MKKTAFLLAALLLCAPAFADDYAIEVRTNKKVIHVEELGLPGNMSVLNALDILPELIGRDSDDILANYQINLQDKSIGVGRDAVLLQLHLSDVDKIEISQTPSASQQKKGQGGVVGIFLKDQTQDGLEGKVMMDVSTETDLMPHLQMSYTSGPWRLFGMTMLEYYHPLNDVSQTVSDYSDRLLNARTFSCDTSVLRYGAQNLMVFANYHPDADNDLKLWLTESASLQKDLDFGTLYGDVPVSSSLETRGRTFSLDASGEYEHYFSARNSIDVEFGYSLSPSTAYTDAVSPANESRNLQQEVSASVKYVHPLRLERNEMKLKGGVNLSGTFSSQHSSAVYEDLALTSGRDFYLSPFVEAEGKIGPVGVLASLRFQHYGYNETVSGDDPFSTTLDEIVGGVNLNWQVADHHNLRLQLAKNIVRPTGLQICPSMSFSVDNNSYIKGNPDLAPTRIYSCNLDYITDLHFGVHDIVLNSGLGYTVTEGIIRLVDATVPATSGYFGLPLEHKTFYNMDFLKSLSLNMMAFYKAGPLSVSLAGNLFSNFQYLDDARASYAYFNLSLSPSLALLQNWTLSANAQYTSKVENLYGHLGDAFNLGFRLTKIWKDWDVHMEFGDIFHNLTEDIVYGSNVRSTRLYYLYRNYFNIGATFKF